MSKESNPHGIEGAIIKPTHVDFTPTGAILGAEIVATSVAVGEEAAREVGKLLGGTTEVEMTDRSGQQNNKSSKTIGLGGGSWARSTWVPEFNRRRPPGNPRNN